MANPVLNAPHFQTEEAAFEYVEARLWPDGPVCPHCGGMDRIGKLQGKTTRPGLRKCYDCKKPFTVRMGSIFEDSHLPLHLWLQVIQLMCASKKGISSRQIQRMLQCSMKTAWFLTHRIRLAMDPGAAEPMGGAGKIVEADETELSKSRKTKRPPGHRRRDNPRVFSLVERGGNIRSLTLDHNMVGPLVRKHVHQASHLVTDKAQHYKFTGHVHESVDHSKFEWARDGKVVLFPSGAPYTYRVHTNTLEGYFSVFKRGLVGTYQHMDSKHLERYLAEFDFRYNTRAKLGIDDQTRAGIAVQGAKGKRLTYETTREA